MSNVKDSSTVIGQGPRFSRERGISLGKGRTQEEGFYSETDVGGPNSVKEGGVPTSSTSGITHTRKRVQITTVRRG